MTPTFAPHGLTVMLFVQEQHIPASECIVTHADLVRHPQLNLCNQTCVETRMDMAHPESDLHSLQHSRTGTSATVACPHLRGPGKGPGWSSAVVCDVQLQLSHQGARVAADPSLACPGLHHPGRRKSLCVPVEASPSPLPQPVHVHGAQSMFFIFCFF